MYTTHLKPKIVANLRQTLKPFHLKPVIAVELLLCTVKLHIMLLLEMLFMKASN